MKQIYYVIKYGEFSVLQLILCSSSSMHRNGRITTGLLTDKQLKVPFKDLILEYDDICLVYGYSANI
jgi:hypothetical protein